MINNTILEYISTERARGVTDEDIRSALLTSGWKEEDINEAFGRGQKVSGALFTQSPRVAPAFSLEYLKYLFEGRIGRFNYFIGSVLLGLLFLPLYALTIYLFFASWGGSTPFTSFLGVMVFTFLCFIFASILELSLVVRRLHDLNQSGWWFLVLFIPFVKFILSIYLFFFKGSGGANSYGVPSMYEPRFRMVWSAVWKK